MSNRTFSMPSRSHLNRPQLLKRQALVTASMLPASVIFQAGWVTCVPAVFIGQSVQGDCSVATGTFEETFHGVVPP